VSLVKQQVSIYCVPGKIVLKTSLNCIGDSSRGWIGKFDDLSIFSNALSQAQIQHLMKNPIDTNQISTDYPTAVMHYDFNAYCPPATTVPNDSNCEITGSNNVFKNYGSAGTKYDLLLGELNNDHGFGKTWVFAGSTTEYPFAAPKLIPSDIPELRVDPTNRLDVPNVIYANDTQPFTVTFPTKHEGAEVEITQIPTGATVTAINGGSAVSAGGKLTVPASGPIITVTVDAGFQSGIITFQTTVGSNTHQVHVWKSAAPELVKTTHVVRLLEDSTATARLGVLSLTGSGEGIQTIVTSVPDKGSLFQVGPSWDETVGDKIVSANTVASHNMGVFSFTPDLDGAGINYTQFKVKFRSEKLGIETGELTVQFDVEGLNDLPTASDVNATVTEDSESGEKIDLKGYDSESIPFYVISKLPSKGTLYEAHASPINETLGRQITKPYQVYDLGLVEELYADEVLAVSSFWGGPPYGGYHAFNVLGSPECGARARNGECDDERKDTDDHVYLPGDLIKVDRNVFDSEQDEFMVYARVTGHISGKGAAAFYNVSLIPMYREVVVDDVTSLEQCVLNSSAKFPPDCEVEKAARLSGLETLTNVPGAAVGLIDQGVWCPLNQGYTGKHLKGTEKHSAYGPQYDFDFDTSVAYLQHGYTEFIEVKFKKKLFPVAFEIGHPRGAGAIVRIKVKDPQDQWYTMYDEKVNQEKFKIVNERHTYFKMNPDICRPFFKADVIRIELDTSSETGIADWNYIDYIKILGSEDMQTSMIRYPSTSVWYKPHENEYGDDSFEYMTYDCGGDRLRSSKPATVAMTITPVEDTPEAQTVPLGEDGFVHANLTANRTEIRIVATEHDDEIVTMTLSKAPDGGTLSDGTGELTTNSAIQVENNQAVLSLLRPVCVLPETRVTHFEVSVTDPTGRSVVQRVEVSIDCPALPRKYVVEDYDYTIPNVLGVVGVIIAALCFLFNFRYREVPVVKLTSPVMNAVIIIGAMLVYLYLIMLGSSLTNVSSCVDLDMSNLELDVNDTRTDYICTGENTCCTDAAFRQCYLPTWLLLLGMVATFGSLFAKTMRLNKIFASKLKKVKRISNATLLMWCGVVASVVVFILIIWAASSPSTMHFELGDQAVNADEVIEVNLVPFCYSKDGGTFEAMFILYFGGLMLYGSYLAYTVRNISLRQANDSKQIGISVYNILTFGSLNVALTKIIPDPSKRALIVSITTFLCATITLGVLYFPRMWDIKIGHTHIDFTSSNGGNTAAPPPTDTSVPTGATSMGKVAPAES